MKEYIIICLEQRSNEGTLLFWKDGGCGYTSDLKQAGMFNKEVANGINKDGRDVAITLRQLDKLNSTKTYTVVDCDLFELRKYKKKFV